MPKQVLDGIPLGLGMVVQIILKIFHVHIDNLLHNFLATNYSQFIFEYIYEHAHCNLTPRLLGGGVWEL